MKFTLIILPFLLFISCSQEVNNTDKSLITKSTSEVDQFEVVKRNQLHKAYWSKRTKEAQGIRDRGYGLVNNEKQLLFDSDSLLNVVYKDLKRILPKQQFGSLKSSQSEWIKYKEKKFNEIWKENDPMFQGEMGLTVKYHSQEEIIEKKLLELIELLETAQSTQLSK